MLMRLDSTFKKMTLLAIEMQLQKRSEVNANDKPDRLAPIRTDVQQYENTIHWRIHSRAEWKEQIYAVAPFG